ncbi:MAG TPA: hypothetical protein PK491_09930, partial [Candidatus Hydrogenedentes bacterium]|nr:hypothetical protein [Candidatus Hydrogenedentota bacterium]
ALEMADPEWIGTLNLIPNGDFEAGSYPYVVESLSGSITCPTAHDIIKRVSDACHGNGAAVFRFRIADAQIASCDVERLAGKSTNATLVITGLNLSSITFVALVPETYAGRPFAEGNYIQLSPAGAPSFVGDMEEIRFPFHFGQPFNAASNGNVICTDGLASFEVAINGELKPGLLDACTTLIDTVPPALVIDTPGGVANACAGSPSICGVNRVFPDANWLMPAGWVPGQIDPDVTPKNAASFAVSDMHVYVNPGSRQDVPYSSADALSYDFLEMLVKARFVDVPPSQGGTSFPVTLSGFSAAAATPATPYVFPEGRPGTARWNGTGVPATTVDSYTQTLVSPADMTVAWRVRMQRGSNADDWQTAFKLLASDRAGNQPDTASQNNIVVHWLYRTAARFSDKMQVRSDPPSAAWQLVGPKMPEAAPACRQLARFRIYRVEDNGTLTPLGQSEWLGDPLQGSTLLGGTAFQAILRNNIGVPLCLDIIGADESGNVQYVPANYSSAGLTVAHLSAAGIDYVLWVHGVENVAINTDIHVKLFTESGLKELNELALTGTLEKKNSFGYVTRVPLPPFDRACEERINADVRFRVIVPTSGLSAVDPDNIRVFWKFYRDGALVASGLAKGNWDESTPPHNLLVDLLRNDADIVQNTEELNTPPANLSNAWACMLPRDRFLARRPDSCMYFNQLFTRLGDEGNPPVKENINADSNRRNEIFYTLTAQTVYKDASGYLFMDGTPARASFSIYASEAESMKLQDTPVREFSR